MQEENYQLLRTPNSVGRHNSTRVDDELGGKNIQNSSRDINEGTYRGREGGGRARYVTPDLSYKYYWDEK